jgi:hypothetical protein
MKLYQAIILVVGIMGILLYLFLSMSLRLQVFGVLTQAEEVRAEIKIYRALFDLSLLMAILALVWRFLLPREDTKYRSLLVVIYLIPLVIDVCMLILAFAIGSYYMHH